MQNHLIATAPETRRRILWIQTVTIIWMAVEAAVALVSSWKARSPALLGFGGDSLIELLSAAVVYWRFRSERTDARVEKQAARIAGALLFALEGFIVIASGAALMGTVRPNEPCGDRTVVGRRVGHALASKRKATSVCRDFKRSVESRCCGIRALRLHGLDCFGRVGAQCGMEDQVGRSVAALSSFRSSCMRAGKPRKENLAKTAKTK